jgi:hypothetical protein
MEQFEFFFSNFVGGGGGGVFVFKLGALCIYMMVEIKVVFTPFTTFASISNVAKAHNMIALMLDDCGSNL